jgi:hypothetical protein
MRILTVTATAAILGLGALISVPTASLAQWGYGPGASVGYPPPPLPVYDQPPIPDYGYIWTPGYWAWDSDYGDYYWVPGTWVLPPEEGLLWTPAWWGWGDGAFLFHPGYWAPYIGYYGGIDYGFGYTGYGYQGGYWRGREFFYNRAVNNVRGARIDNLFERPVLGAPQRNHVSYSGGMGGVAARPTPEQIAAMRERHVAPTADQARHVQMAGSDRRLSAKVNQGAPPIAATPRPAAFAPPARVSPPPFRPQGGVSPPRIPGGGFNPGARPSGPPPQTYTPTHPGFSQAYRAAAPPARQPNVPVTAPPANRPPVGNVAGPSPAPPQGPPRPAERTPPPRSPAEPKGQPPH